MDEQANETIATSAEKRFKGDTLEYRQNNREKIILVLSKDPDKWWNINPLADKIDAGFQSVRSILLKLTIEGKVIMDDSDGRGRAYFKFNKEKAGEDLLKLWMPKKKVEEEKKDKDDKDRFALCPFCGAQYNLEHYPNGHNCEERRKYGN